MQDLIIYNKKEVIIQANNTIYQDTPTNFLIDYGKIVEYETIDYNRATEGCWLNGNAFQDYPNAVCEDILDSIDILLAAKAAREYIEAEPPTPEEIQANLTQAVQAHMDKTAQERHYDDIFTATSYVNSSDPVFAAEASALLLWRDQVWRLCYTILDEVKAGVRPIPSVTELLNELPKFVWPEV